MRSINKFIIKLAIGALGMGLVVSADADETAFYFGTGSAKLQAGAMGKLVKKVGKGSNWHVAGFSDPRGSEAVNNRLRAERGQSARKALMAAGISEDQIVVEDGGAPTDTDPKDYWKLRRVAVRYDAKAVASADERRIAEEKHAAELKAATERAVEEKRAAMAEEKRTGVKAAVVTRPPDSKNPEAATKLESIKLIYWRSLNHSLWIIAKEKGFFAAEGFDVELRETDENAKKIAEHVGVAAGVQSDKALMAGQKRYTAGAVCGFATHEAMAKGDPIVDIGSMIMIPETLLMKKELAAALDKDIRAFKDKKIGDVTYGAGEHEFRYNNVLRVHLEKYGLEDKKDFQIMEYNDPNKEIADLLSGKLDVAKVFPPADLEFMRQHPEYTRVPFAKFFPYLPCCRQVVTRSQLKENRGKYVRLLRASIRAHQFTVEHPKEAAEIIGRWLKIPPSLVRQSVMSAYVTLTPDPMRKGVELYQRTNDRFTKTKTSTAEFIDTSLYRDALFGLARENEETQSAGYFTTMISRFRSNN